MKRRKGRKINYTTIKKMRVFTFVSRHLHGAALMLMMLHLMIRHLVDKLEAASVLMCREAFKAAESCSTWSARVIGWEPADSAEMTLGQLRWWRHGCRVIGAVRIHLTILLEKLLKRFSVFDAVIISAAWLFAFSRVSRSIEIAVELWNLLRHDKIRVWIVMVIVLLQSFECLLRAPLSCHIVKHSLLISVFDSTRFTCCHRFLL